MTRHRVLSIAVATYRVGYVYFVGRKLMLWGASQKAAKSPEAALPVLKYWIATLQPNVVITEAVGGRTRKGRKSIAIIEAIASHASQTSLTDIAVPRIRQFNNKYEEAEAIAERFRAIAHLLPSHRPRIWESEPKQMIIFEAIVLALGIVTDGNIAGTKPLF